jgi:hypothetical protein
MIETGSLVVDFAPYAISEAPAAANAINRMPPALQAVVKKLEFELAQDPARHRMWKMIVNGATVFFPPQAAVEITYTLDEKQRVLTVLDVATPIIRRRLLFISYSHSNKEHVALVREYLQTLEKIGIIKLWSDTEILAGDRWSGKIDEALQCAGAAVLMVTEEFLGSAFIQDVEVAELLKKADEFGTKIFWIHVDPSSVFQTHPHIAQLQSPLSNPKKSLWERQPAAVRRRACVEISENIQRALSA